MHKTVTVAALIEELKKWPAEAVVKLEGCDCYGYADGSVEALDDAPEYEAEYHGVAAGTKRVVLKRGENP